MADVESQVELVEQKVETKPAPEYDPTPAKPEVSEDEKSGRVEQVVLDHHVTADSPHAVQIPPEADGTTNNTLGSLGEPSPEEVFGSSASKSSAKSSSSSSSSSSDK